MPTKNIPDLYQILIFYLCYRKKPGSLLAPKHQNCAPEIRLPRAFGVKRLKNADGWDENVQACLISDWSAAYGS
jgi:hypothetical protein